MSYKAIKWLILTIPTLAIGLWEYLRHEFLLPYISMELGNWLTPVIVLLVSLLLLTQLFRMIEHNQEELNRAKAVQAVMEEREKIARELHDGIAQSLFFLNAQVMQMEKRAQGEAAPLAKLKESVLRANDYVRQAIASLRHVADSDKHLWLQSVDSLIRELEQESQIAFQTEWSIPEAMLTSREKVELLAIIREAMLNSYKHADASVISLMAETAGKGWICRISDDGKGFDPEQATAGNRYGIKMMRDRARQMSWQLSFDRINGETQVTIAKGVG